MVTPSFRQHPHDTVCTSAVFTGAMSNIEATLILQKLKLSSFPRLSQGLGQRSHSGGREVGWKDLFCTAAGSWQLAAFSSLCRLCPVIHNTFSIWGCFLAVCANTRQIESQAGTTRSLF